MTNLLESGAITVEGRLVDASNATLFVSITDGVNSTTAIYKPVAGERPLWDFPDGNLANRERAAFLIDHALGFNHVPKTILRDGPFGVGMVQLWIDIDEEIDLEDFFRMNDPQLREVALFDAIINNTDRKIGHLIPEKGGHLYICDHGVTFHAEDKLRTVLWQWAGERLTAVEIGTLESLRSYLESQDANELHGLLTQEEISAMKVRIEKLISTSIFPEPNPEWPHIPWPPF
jgi:uncharacterized repeat protein (TIGR03843 family)